VGVTVEVLRTIAEGLRFVRGMLAGRASRAAGPALAGLITAASGFVAALGYSDCRPC
jgi:hypothetical protein